MYYSKDEIPYLTAESLMSAFPGTETKCSLKCPVVTENWEHFTPGILKGFNDPLWFLTIAQVTVFSLSIL